jgi:hypothetical protein
MNDTEELTLLLVELSHARRLRRRLLSMLKSPEANNNHASLECEAEENAAKIRLLIERRKIVGRRVSKSHFGNAKRPPRRRAQGRL